VKVAEKFRPTCSFVKTALDYLVSKNKQVGIISSRSEWTTAFGSLTACPEILDTVAFWNSTSGTLTGAKNYTRQTKTSKVNTCGISFEAYSID